MLGGQPKRDIHTAQHGWPPLKLANTVKCKGKTDWLTGPMSMDGINPPAYASNAKTTTNRSFWIVQNVPWLCN